MTGRLEPKLVSGSLLDFYSLQWGSIYRDVLSILGPTGLILAGGDPRYGQPNAATFETAGVPATFTWSAAPSGFLTPLDLLDKASFQGIVPLITLDPAFGGEYAKSPDADLWSRGDGSADGPFTFGIWLSPANATDDTVIWSKWNETDAGGLIRESKLFFKTGGRPALEFYDESADGSISRRSDTALVKNVLSFLVVTYNGAGLSRVGDIKLYIDAAQVSSTSFDSGSYTAMENGSASAVLGGIDGFLGVGADNTLDAKVALGPCGPGFSHKELTDLEVAAWHDVTRRPLMV